MKEPLYICSEADSSLKSEFVVESSPTTSFKFSSDVVATGTCLLSHAPKDITVLSVGDVVEFSVCLPFNDPSLVFELNYDANFWAVIGETAGLLKVRFEFKLYY